MLVAAQDTHSENRMASYYRARYYDPAGGRFINEDPIGFYGGTNFYEYVLNEPLNLRDPSGKNPWRNCYRVGRGFWDIDLLWVWSLRDSFNGRRNCRRGGSSGLCNLQLLQQGK